jgi:hypothetical protein
MDATMRRALLASLIACACMPAGAHATQTEHLGVKLTPERLGHSTSLELQITIAAPAGRLPSPLTALAVHYPSLLGLSVSGLGLTACQEETLAIFGPKYCPASSRMGSGSIRAELQFATATIPETASVAIVRGSEQDGHVTMLFFAEGRYPIDDELTFPGQLLAGPSAEEETIQITVPLLPGLPRAPYASLVSVNATFGSRGLVYYERLHGRLLPYTPKGILLPNRCPKGGFRFSATFGFLDGSHPTAFTDVPCPKRRLSGPFTHHSSSNHAALPLG